MSPSPSQPEFFIDRSLARRDVARELRRCGWRIRTHLEVYEERDQDVLDVEWLVLCGSEGWAVLTMDRRIRYNRVEVAAIRRHRVQAFVLTTGNLTSLEQARRFGRNRASIEEACRHPGPFIYAVHENGIVQIFPG